jgi:cation diffusion facilitator family transporter
MFWTHWPPVIRFAWLAIAAAVVTITLKTGAYLLTGSVSLLSDAMESVVNLVAAVVALITLHIARKDPDRDHAYGHTKAEYFSSALEGALILVAAGSIVVTSVPRLIEPEPLEQVGWGLAVASVATVVNLVVSLVLTRAARLHRSITLEADARHLMTDVVTSIGVLIGVFAVTATGWHRLDPVIALVVAVNIIWTGIHLLRESMLGLLDTAIPEEELAAVEAVLDRYQAELPVQIHALRTRRAGARQFISMHVLVPGSWTVERGHDLAERIEHDILDRLPQATVFTHIEPAEDPASWDDTGLDRADRNDAPPGVG